MQSKAPDVSTYLKEASPERRQALEKLRALCREVLVGFEERMDYGMPTYMRDDVGVAFANQKNYISLYILEDVLDAHRDQLEGMNCGKGCIRYTSPKKVDYEVVRSLLESTVTTSGSPR
jgi:uncharacterized protein YdhG (YjbR/CyaY superfamily)